MTNEITIRHMEYENFYIDRTGESLYSTGPITIDWGDGTTETTNNNTYSYSHNYYNFTHDNEGDETYSGYITVTISGVEEIRDGFLADAHILDQYVDAVTISDNITSIGDDFCYNKMHLHYLTLSNSLTSIGDNFCYMCYLSNGLELPNSLTSIGDNFCNAAGYLDTLTLPDSITTIGNNFCASSALTSFTIPNSIISIGDGFLDGCSFLTGNIIIPNSVESIGNNFLNWCGITSIIFETNSAIDVIPDNFACKCMNLININFPDNLETIGTNFCCSCPSLTRVEFPEGLIEIGENFLNGEEDSMHLNKLIFPSSFRYLDDGLSGVSIDKVIFKSVTPVDISAGYPNQFDSMIIHVPKNCINAYVNAFTKAFGDYGEDSLSDPNHYRENLTLPEATAKFGTLMRTKLAEKGISSNANDGLTTLVNKIKDIQTRTPRTGLLADIGFYDPSHWSGNTFGMTEDTLSFYNGTTEFNFTTETLPNNFTIGFVVTLHSSYDAITFNQIQPPLNMNYIVGPFDADIVHPDDEFRYTFEFEVIITRQNGGALKVCVPMSGDVWTSNNTLNLSIQPNSYITLSEIFYSYNYSDVESNNFESPYEMVAYFSNWTQPHNSINLASVPSTFPVLLMKDNRIIKRYDIFSGVTEYPFLLNWEEPYSTYNRFWQSPPYDAWEYLVQGAWHLKLRSDTSNYSWITTDDLYYPIGNYIRLKGKGENRIDTYLNRYIYGDGDSWESFDQYTTVLNQNMPQDWLISFDYTYKDSTQNQNAEIQIGADNNNCVKLVISRDNIRLISNTGDAWQISNDFDIPLNITLYTKSTVYYDFNEDLDGSPDELHITYWLCINEYERGFETSWVLFDNQPAEDILVHNLYKVVQNDNVDITNLMYMHFDIRDYEPPL